MTENRGTHRRLAIFIANMTTPAEKDEIVAWAAQLLAIRLSERSLVAKARAALAATASADVVWPTIHLVALKTKALGWDRRTSSQRLGIGGAAAGVVLFGGQTAGVAALGSALAVPLWLVLGSGVYFAHALIEEIRSRQPVDEPALHP